MKETPVIQLNIKPVSNNLLYGITKRGHKYKKKDAVEFEKNCEWALKVAAFNMRLTSKEDLELITRVYVSRKFDTSNCLKLFEDCVARHFKINDRRFAGHRISRVVVKEGQERIRFKIQEYDDSIFVI